MSRVVVIGNPKAGRGKTNADWSELLAHFTRAGLEADLASTQSPGHAIELARRARAEGADLVVAFGGDGTVHEVVNGLLAGGPGEDLPVLGVIPGGSGCDYAKTFGIPSDTAQAVQLLVSSSPVRMVDVGEVVFDGGLRYFANIAEIGIGAEVVGRAAQLPRILGGAVYFGAFWLTLPGFKRRTVHVRVDETPYDGPLTNMVVAIGRFFGGGMKVAPTADPADGAFDVQLQTGSKLDFVRAIPKVYKGTHVPHPRVLESRGALITVESRPPALIEADGEVLGWTPATFKILPDVLRLKA
jgi:YegS/Rv2252/BmrU family lipid kinase